MLSSLSIESSHYISAVVLAKAIYSTFVLDHATVDYFLQLQEEIRLFPKKT